MGAPHPNPTRGGVSVPITLSSSAQVRLSVHDVLGREVARLHDGALEAGDHRFEVAPSALVPGVYLVRASVDGAALVRRFTVIR